MSESQMTNVDTVLIRFISAAFL